VADLQPGGEAVGRSAGGSSRRRLHGLDRGRVSGGGAPEINKREGWAVLGRRELGPKLLRREPNKWLSAKNFSIIFLQMHLIS
jgi:hypothetical protein